MDPSYIAREAAAGRVEGQRQQAWTVFSSAQITKFPSAREVPSHRQRRRLGDHPGRGCARSVAAKPR